MVSIIRLYQEERITFWDDLDELIYDKARYYASDLIRFLDLNEYTFSEALDKAKKALVVLDKPLKYNIKSVYRSTTEGIIRDIKLSPLAAYFFSIHIDPSIPLAAKLQFYFASRYGFDE